MHLFISLSINRYFMLDFETGILQYFVNEQSKNQKPRGLLSLAGAVVSLSDEAPHMLVVYSANGEMYKLRGMVICYHCCFWCACVPSKSATYTGFTFRGFPLKPKSHIAKAHWVQCWVGLPTSFSPGHPAPF